MIKEFLSDIFHENRKFISKHWGLFFALIILLSSAWVYTKTFQSFLAIPMLLSAAYITWCSLMMMKEGKRNKKAKKAGMNNDEDLPPDLEPCIILHIYSDDAELDTKTDDASYIDEQEIYREKVIIDWNVDLENQINYVPLPKYAYYYQFIVDSGEDVYLFKSYEQQ